MSRFWGTLLGINFAPGVTAGIAQEFQFGTNWVYYSHANGWMCNPVGAEFNWQTMSQSARFVRGVGFVL